MIFSCFPWTAIFVVEGNWISMWTKFLINHQTGRAEDKSHQLAVDSSPYVDTESSLNPGLEFCHLHDFDFTFTIFLPNLHFLHIVNKIIFLGFAKYLDFFLIDKFLPLVSPWLCWWTYADSYYQCFHSLEITEYTWITPYRKCRIYVKMISVNYDILLLPIKKNIFVYFGVCWVFVSLCRLSLAAARGECSL